MRDGKTGTAGERGMPATATGMRIPCRRHGFSCGSMPEPGNPNLQKRRTFLRRSPRKRFVSLWRQHLSRRFSGIGALPKKGSLRHRWQQRSQPPRETIRIRRPRLCRSACWDKRIERKAQKPRSPSYHRIRGLPKKAVKRIAAEIAGPKGIRLFRTPAEKRRPRTQDRIRQSSPPTGPR